MKNQNRITIPVLILISAIIASCSGRKKEEERLKARNDSIARVIAVNDSIKKLEAQFPNQLVIQGMNVNLRVSPSIEAVRIKQLKTGDTCEVLEKSSRQTVAGYSDYWYRVRFKNKEGWVFGTFTSLKQMP